MPTRHAILSPSGAYIWRKCAPSARFTEQIPEEDSVYSIEGTLAHAIAAIILGYWAGYYKGREDALALDYAQATLNAYQFYVALDTTDDPDAALATMIEHCETYATYVLELGGEIIIEREYDLSEVAPLSFGTADATNRHATILYITDYKYGAGKPVSAKENPQLRLYAIGAVLESMREGYDIQHVVMSIVQPRVGEPSTDEMSVKDLLAWGMHDIRPVALLAISGQGEFVPGNHCQFCKANTICKARYDQFSTVMGIMDKRIMSGDDVATVLGFGGGVASWIKKVEERAATDLRTGKRIPGFKLVAGRGQRAFRDENELVDIMIGLGYDTDDIFKSEIKGITAIEELLGPARFAEVFNGVIINKEAKPKVVSEDDPARAIDATAGDAYNETEDYG